MKKTLQIIFAILIFTQIAFAQNFCNTISDEPPTCFYGCPTIAGQLGGFTPDIQVINTTCSGNANTQWLKIIAEEDIFTMTLMSTSCPFTRRIQTEVFDKNNVSVSDCIDFLPRQIGKQLTASVIPGEEYLVMIKEESGLNCNYEFELRGHQREIFGNTDDIQFESGSTLSYGELYLPLIPGVDDYNWETFSSDLNITIDSIGNRLTYTYSGVDSAKICVTPANICGFGNEICAYLPFIGCPAGSQTLPGCLVECPNLKIKLSELTVNAFRGYRLDCQTDTLTEAYWFSLIADETSIIIEQKNRFPADLKIQIFDQNGNPVSNCRPFGSYSSSQVVATNIIIGDTYSVCVGTESSLNANSFLDLSISGSSSLYEPLPKIIFEPGSTLDSGAAFIDSSYVIDSLVWGTVQSVNVLSGQGTNRITYRNINSNAYLTLRGFTDECGELTERALFPGAVPGGISPPPCLPTIGGIPAGDNAPGCSLCGPIYQGSTVGYTATSPGSGGFPCGTVENNQFISVIADATGRMEATILASSCTNNQGVQLMIFDQNFNPVSNCFSSGGTNFPGNITASNLTPGETYWVMIDGFAGDQCDILFVISGGINYGPPDPPGPIYAFPDTSPLCPGAVVCYSIDQVDGASEYEWTIPRNGVIASGGGIFDTEICIEYNAPGGGVVRVTPSNPCFPGVPALEPVVILPILPTLKPPEFICLDDFPIVRDGNTFTEAGTHEIIYLTGLGCDSVVTYVFIPNVQIPNIIDTTICIGSCVMIGDTCYDQPIAQTIQLGPPYQQANECDSIVILKISYDSTSSISSDFTADSNVCISEAVNVNYTGTASSTAIYDWNFNGATVLSGSGVGPYQIAFADGGAYEITLTVSENGCASARSSQTTVVNDRLADPVINCQTSLSFVNFFWNPVAGASDYQVTVLTGQTGTLNGTEFEVFGLSPNEEVQIEVTAISGVGCDNSMATLTCKAQDCSPLNLSINPINDICLNQNAMPIQLTASPSNLTGTFVWSGPGVAASGIFDPNMANMGPNQISVTYSENSCDYSANSQVNIIMPPTADFTTDNVICISDNLAVNYTGDASLNANYNWNFGGGNIATNSGSTNYEINFPSNGTYDISLSVEENGCVSDPISQTILVENQLNAPVISCAATTTSVEFAWNDVAGADSYNVSVISGQTGTLTGRTYSIQNLNPGDQVEIEVTANSTTSCPNVSVRATCVAENCLPVDLDIIPLGDFCEGSEQIMLSANTIGGVGGGTMTWSGPEVQGNILDITSLAPGNYFIALEYAEGACIYTDTQSFRISAQPSISSEVLSPLWSPGTIGSIDLTVSGGIMPYTYNWSNGATTEDLTDVTRGQLYCVTVTNSAGCEEQDCYEIGAGIFRLNPIHVVCRNEPKRLSIRPSRGGNFSWSPATDLSCSNCASPTITASQSRYYDVAATLGNGRTDTLRIFVLVLPSGFCNSPRINDLIDEKLSISNLNFQNSDETDLINFEKEITESLLKDAVSIAPNPTAGIINIESVFNIENAEVFDFSGRKMFSKKDVFEKRNQSEIDLSAFAKGVYFIKIKTGGKVVVKRVVLI